MEKTTIFAQFKRPNGNTASLMIGVCGIENGKVNLKDLSLKDRFISDLFSEDIKGCTYLGVCDHAERPVKL